MLAVLTKRNILLLGVTLGCFLVSTSSVIAATIRFSAGQGYGIGDTVPVQVLVGTDAGVPLNAVSASVAFPTDKLQLQSISKAGSIVSYWVEEPVSSNALGTASFEGLVLNPGWSGNAGQVVTLNFKVKATGPATVSFSKASILANDGLGTNILSSATPLTISLAAGAPVIETEVAPTPEPVVASAPAPVVRSSTHPEQGAWYKNDSPSFSWNVPGGVTAVRLLYDKNAASTPTVEYAPAISSKTLDDVEDGAYYFHIQFKSAGGWGVITHYKFNIDTNPPQDFSITFKRGEKAGNLRPMLEFATTDAESGIEKYLVKVGNEKAVTIAADSAEAKGYTPANLKSGENTILVTAYDKAGNTREREETISAVIIDAPVIQEYSRTLDVGKSLRVVGKTYPNATVAILVKDKEGVVTSETARATSAGNFTLLWSQGLPSGVYSFTAYVVDDEGGFSPETDPNTFKVEKGGAPSENYSFITNYLVLGFFIILITGLLAALVIYLFHHLRYFNNRVESGLHSKFHKLERGVRRDFEILNEEVESYFDKLKKAERKRELTREEKSFLKNFRKYLSAVEKDVVEKIESVEPEGTP